MKPKNSKSISSNKEIRDAKVLLELLLISSKNIQQAKVKTISKTFSDLKKSINKFKEEQKPKYSRV